jgi:hypothetical protein
VLLRALAVGLSFLRCVYSSKTDPVFLSIAVEKRDRIAVCDTHYSALQNLSRGGNAPDRERKISEEAYEILWHSHQVRI